MPIKTIRRPVCAAVAKAYSNASAEDIFIVADSMVELEQSAPASRYRTQERAGSRKGGRRSSYRDATEWSGDSWETMAHKIKAGDASLVPASDKLMSKLESLVPARKAYELYNDVC